MDSKIAFLFGLVTGVAIFSFLSLVLLVAQNSSLQNKSTKTQDSNKTVVANPTQNTVPTPTNFKPVPLVSADDHILGNKDAKVTLIEYSDFECPFCGKFFDTVKQVMAEYKGDVRLVYRHFPLSFHPNAQKAAEASECAGEQGKFYEMHDAIFAAAKAKEMSVEKWKAEAKNLGLKTDQFDKCLDSGKYFSKTQKQLSEGSASGVTGTPGTFVNGELIKGAQPIENVKAIIDKYLKK